MRIVVGFSNIENFSKELAHSPEGTSYRLNYVGTPSTVVTIGNRKGKKTIKFENDYRGNIINGPASVRKIIGVPMSAELI